jgi:hypothetical protein
MANDAKKKVAALIVAGMPPPGKLKEKSGGAMDNDEDMADGGADDEMEAKDAAEESAFADLRAALKSGDDKAGVQAFKEFLEHCGYSKGE